MQKNNSIPKDSKVFSLQSKSTEKFKKEISIITYDATIQDIKTYINKPFYLREGYHQLEEKDICPSFFIKINGILSEKTKEIIRNKKENRNVFYNNDYTFHLSEPIKLKKLKQQQDILKIKKQTNHLHLLQKEQQEKVCHILFEFFEIHQELSNNIKQEILSTFIYLPIEFLDAINTISINKIPPRIIYKEYTKFNINKKKEEYETPESYFYIFEILHQIGFDIMIINSYGIETIEQYIELPIIKLETLKKLESKNVSMIDVASLASQIITFTFFVMTLLLFVKHIIQDNENIIIYFILFLLISPFIAFLFYKTFRFCILISMKIFDYFFDIYMKKF